MSRGFHRFKLNDVARAIRAARSAGVENPVIEVDPDGRIRIDCSGKANAQQVEDVTEKI